MNRRFWTFNTLVGAFLDLFIAYFLLCGSTIALFAVKFLGFFGLSLPTPDNGFFGIPNSDFRSLLVDYPTDKISEVQYSVTRKFPYDSVFFSAQNRNHNEDLNLDNRNGDRFMELEGEASCGSKSDSRKPRVESDESGIRAEKQRGFDMKGKVALNYRLRGSFRRRRKSIFDSGKHSSVSSSPNWITCVDQQSNDDKESSVLSGANNCNNEAMLMILRLQEEKASIEMEARQYQRMIEEKSAYDEEEMNILKEIVLRREREKHFLEKEVEAYRQMIRVENDQFNVGSNEDFTQDPELMSDQVNMNIPERKNSRLFEDVEFTKQEETEKTIAIVGEEKGMEIDASRGGESDSPVFDVHVIDNDPKSTGNKLQTDRKQSGSETSVGLPPVSGSKSSLRRNSTSALDYERSKLDTEVEWLRERLRTVQEGREKLNVSVDSREKESLQLQLLEDIARQLQEIRMLTEPRSSRQASLPLPSSKVLCLTLLLF
ncbi:hypothetical protein E3N88_01187 [Mikania micrantha]|uniref:GTD-binding domain-containing protein n=1 Tax=Mikania micrantha TaxID=192012 RepID=A0A5N6Q265_9ASTR|nr:hypothetical protein E3N88_01187 [Mikania micrantha]